MPSVLLRLFPLRRPLRPLQPLQRQLQLSYPRRYQPLCQLLYLRSYQHLCQLLYQQRHLPLSRLPSPPPCPPPPPVSPPACLRRSLRTLLRAGTRLLGTSADTAKVVSVPTPVQAMAPVKRTSIVDVLRVWTVSRSGPAPTALCALAPRTTPGLVAL
jgi:hypothetical protein